MYRLGTEVSAVLMMFFAYQRYAELDLAWNIVMLIEIAYNANLHSFFESADLLLFDTLVEWIG